MPPLPCTAAPRGYRDSGANGRLMEITDDAIEEFMGIWENTYGEKIPRSEALHHARQLLQLLDAVYGPS